MTAPDDDARVLGGRRGDTEMGTTGTIIPLPLRRRNCAVCRILFTPRSIQHTLCPNCYAWVVHAHHVRLAVTALRERP